MQNFSALPLPKLIFLILHIAGGITSLIVGLVPMVAQKGGKLHRRSGWVYTLAMTDVFISSVMLSVVLPLMYGTPLNLFLLFIGVFSIYFVFSGLRGLRFHRPRREHGASAIDYVAVLLLFLLSLMLLYFTFFNPYDGKFDFNLIYMVFALFGVNITRIELIRFRTPFNAKIHRHQYFFHHIVNMCASYISAATAFVVVNAKYFPIFPPIVFWLGPGLIGGFFISYWVRHYKKKMGVGQKHV